jgi:hypothetical protein
LAQSVDGVAGWDTVLQVGMSRMWLLIRCLDFSIGLILPAATWPPSRPAYQEYSFLEARGGRRIRLTTPLPSLSRMWGR